MNKKFVIYNLNETLQNTCDDNQPMFWNDEDGWGVLATATIFTEQQKEYSRLPLFNSIWLELPKG